MAHPLRHDEQILLACMKELSSMAQMYLDAAETVPVKQIEYQEKSESYAMEAARVGMRLIKVRTEIRRQGLDRE